MPRGYPDFFGSATFFKFGNMRAESDSVSVGAGATETLLDIAYKGKVYGGYIRWSAAADWPEAIFTLTLDGEVVTLVSSALLKIHSITEITQQLLKLTRYEYDGTNYNITLAIAPDITYDYQFKLEGKNNYGVGVIFTIELLMAQVA